MANASTRRKREVAIHGIADIALGFGEVRHATKARDTTWAAVVGGQCQAQIAEPTDLYGEITGSTAQVLLYIKGIGDTQFTGCAWHQLCQATRTNGTDCTGIIGTFDDHQRVEKFWIEACFRSDLRDQLVQWLISR
jgi:hypothetical protein